MYSKIKLLGKEGRKEELLNGGQEYKHDLEVAAKNVYICPKKVKPLSTGRSKRKYKRSKGMETIRTFVTGPEPSKVGHSQRCLCSQDFM